MPTAKKKTDPNRIQAASIDDLIQGKKPMTKDVVIHMDDEGPELIRKAKRDLERTRVLRKDDEVAITEAEVALDEAYEKARANARVMRFRATGRKAYDRLLDEHPATEEQHEEERARTKNPRNPEGSPAPYNGDTFPQALVAASCFEPRMSIEQVQQAWDDWNAGELTELFTTAIEVNSNRRVAELGN